MSIHAKLFFLLALSLFLSLPASAATVDAPKIENIALFLHDGVEVLDFAGPLEVFSQAGFHVYTCSLSTEPITSQGVLRVLPDHGLEDCPQPDLVAFFGGGWAPRIAEQPEVKRWVERTTGRTALDFSVCTGAFFLGQAGLLDGRQATTFHSAIPILAKAFPKAEVLEGVRFVDNGEVITTAGISAGIDGALHVVSKIRGPQMAERIAEVMEYDKWVPGEGRILPSPFAKAAAAQGLEHALGRLEDGELPAPFKGELIGLALAELSGATPATATRALRFVIDHYKPNRFDFANLGDALRAMGETAPPTEKTILAWARAGQSERIRRAVTDTAQNHPGWLLYSEWSMNQIGYEHLEGENAATAVAIFRVNVLAFPESANAHDSLGEGLLELGRHDEARASFRRALELDPDLESARVQLERLASKSRAAAEVSSSSE